MKPVGHHAALVNGGGAGLGRAITAVLAHEGFRVCAADPDALALRATALAVGRQRLVALAGPAGDADHQDDAVERALSTFGRIDVLVNVVGAGTVAALLEGDAAAGTEPFALRATAETDALLGWIEKVDLAWTAEHGGTILNVFDPAVARDGRWPARIAARLSRFTADLSDRLGPAARMTSLLPAPSGVPGVSHRPSRSAPVMPLRTAATVPEVALYLLSRRGQGLAGRTLLATRPGVPWVVVDAPLPAPSRGTVAALRAPERPEQHLAPAVGWHQREIL